MSDRYWTGLTELISGMYLWIPRRIKWPFIRGALFFNPQANDSKARDYNWHNVFGIWSSIPLIVVVTTAAVFSYPWANNLVYQIVGEDPPSRGLRGGPGRQSRSRDYTGTQQEQVSSTIDIDELFNRAAMHLDNWQTISMRIPQSSSAPVNFSLDQGNGGQPQKRHQLILDQKTGKIINWQPFESQSPGRRLRVFIRFLHTGEALGISGQTVAGLVSLTSIIMIWTGITLAYRRLILPLFIHNKNG